MPDLDTTYLGLALRSPIVASAGPLTGDPDTAARLADAGAGAIVLPSLFEEEIVHEQVELDGGAGSRRRALRRGARLLPGAPGLPERRRPLPRPTSSRTKARVAGAGDRQPQRHLARRVGPLRPPRSPTPAPTPSSSTSTGSPPTPTADAAEVEADDLALVADVRAAVDDPGRRQAVAVLLVDGQLRRPGRRTPAPTGSSCSTASTNPTSTSTRSTIVPRLELSSPWELRLPLRWIAILRPMLHGRASLAATSGVDDRD